MTSLREHARFVGRKVAWLLAIGVACGLALGVIEVAFAYGLQAFLVAIGVLDPAAALMPRWMPSLGLKTVFSLIAGIGVVRGSLLALNYYFQGCAYEEFLYAMRSRLLRWALHSQSASTSEITGLFNARAVGAASAVYSWQALVVQGPIFLMLGASLLVMSPLLTLSAGAALLVLAPPMLWLDKRIKSVSAAAIGDWDRANERLVMSIKNLLLLQIYGMQDEEDRLAQDSLSRYREGTTRHYGLAALKIAAPQILGLLVVCLIAVVAKKRALLSPGVLASYFYIFLRLVQTVAAGNQAYSALMFGLPHYEVLIGWWRGLRAEGPEPGAAGAGALPGGLLGWELDGVSFRYSPDSPLVLSELAARLRPGETTVVTGPSGTGKSTLLGVLLGNLAPTSGEVTVVGADGRRLPLAQCRAALLPRVGYVGPESFLIEGTVHDNLVYGVPDKPSRAAVDEALRLAECQFLLALPKGLEHVLTEQGQGLSAGQKQRLSLARALLRKPTVLILDEATSNLDMETEARLVDTLARLKGSMTIVAVTHRRELLRIADQHLGLDAAERPRRDPVRR